MATRLTTLALAGVAAASAALVQKRATASVFAECTNPGVIAVTFDDGPYAFTDTVLDLFGEAGMKATFFLNGDNWASIYDYKDTVQRAVDEGHQIGSHTWSHPDIATLSPEDLTKQMTLVEGALVDIVGQYPTYMRPPFFSWSPENLQTLGDLGYKVIHADVDTLDWEGDMEASIANFNDGIDAGGSIVLAHDVHEATVETLVPAMISAIQASGLQAVTVGECLGDPASNWYALSRDDPPTDPEPSDPAPSISGSTGIPPSATAEPTFSQHSSVFEPGPTGSGLPPTGSTGPSEPSSEVPSESESSAPTGTPIESSIPEPSSRTLSKSESSGKPTATDPTYPEGPEPSSKSPSASGSSAVEPTATYGTYPEGPPAPSSGPSSAGQSSAAEITATDPTYPEGPSPTSLETPPTKIPSSCRAKKLRRKAKRAAARRLQARK